jgi:hypothetical protein
MNKVEIYCKTCYVVQEYKGQTNCANPNCNDRLSSWHVATQLQAKEAVPVMVKK